MNTILAVGKIAFSQFALLAAEGGIAISSEDIIKKLIISLVIGLFVGIIYALSLKGHLTSVYSNNTAADYKKPGSFKVELSKELFMYSKTEKKEKPQENKTE